MRILVQRVKKAKVMVENRVVSEIEKGLLLFVGIGIEDKKEDLEYLAKKVVNLRIFEDEKGKMNLSIRQIGAEILSVPQFTLYGDTQKGNRPGFDNSAKPERAKEFWTSFSQLLKDEQVMVKTGVFAAKMDIELTNDGPVTIWLDSKTLLSG